MEVLKNVSFEVHRSEAVGLLGPNGAGKTTSFHVITGLISPNKGKVLIDGVEITKYPIHIRSRLGLGYLPQEPSVFRGLSVEENLISILEYTTSFTLYPSGIAIGCPLLNLPTYLFLSGSTLILSGKGVPFIT